MSRVMLIVLAATLMGGCARDAERETPDVERILAEALPGKAVTCVQLVEMLTQQDGRCIFNRGYQIGEPWSRGRHLNYFNVIARSHRTVISPKERSGFFYLNSIDRDPVFDYLRIEYRYDYRSEMAPRVSLVIRCHTHHRERVEACRKYFDQTFSAWNNDVPSDSRRYARAPWTVSWHEGRPACGYPYDFFIMVRWTGEETRGP